MKVLSAACAATRAVAEGSLRGCCIAIGTNVYDGVNNNRWCLPGEGATVKYKYTMLVCFLCSLLSVGYALSQRNDDRIYVGQTRGEAADLLSKHIFADWTKMTSMQMAIRDPLTGKQAIPSPKLKTYLMRDYTCIRVVYHVPQEFIATSLEEFLELPPLPESKQIVIGISSATRSTGYTGKFNTRFTSMDELYLTDHSFGWLLAILLFIGGCLAGVCMAWAYCVTWWKSRNTKLE